MRYPFTSRAVKTEKGRDGDGWLFSSFPPSVSNLTVISDTHRMLAWVTVKRSFILLRRIRSRRLTFEIGAASGATVGVLDK